MRKNTLKKRLSSRLSCPKTPQPSIFQAEIAANTLKTLAEDIDKIVYSWKRQMAIMLKNHNMREYQEHENKISAVQEWKKSMQVAYEEADKSKYLDVKRSIMRLREATKEQKGKSFSVPLIADGSEFATPSNCTFTRLHLLHKDMYERM